MPITGQKQDVMVEIRSECEEVFVQHQEQDRSFLQALPLSWLKFHSLRAFLTHGGQFGDDGHEHE